ncbi:MAG TPA: 4-hydroxythreonine-4-phosphate dehydrogenase PdxA [Hyphomicrobiaceae bacterium]|nr:4-hydroxythreonine-4-phosphate dehydrogenase PdxA [Hyphomicrobiaceae bacterium]
MASGSGRTKPTVALAMGDPAGISPELTARLLALEEVRAAAHLIVVGDRRVLDEGACIAKVALDVEPVAAEEPLPAAPARPLFVDLGHLDPASIARGKISPSGGRFAKENFLSALALAKTGAAHAVAFTPFNKGAMRLAQPDYDDEISFTAKAIGFAGEAREFNVLDGLWNARVTSHVPLSAVAGLLSAPLIVKGLELTHAAMSAAGFSPPRIGVAALNPHAGDNGNFGREEIDIIEPAVREAKARGIACDGPYPADTVFVRARAGQFDGVLTMFHDQGQIAMKLIGFEAGVTLLGGFPMPIATPAHGTAYDIAGRGLATVGASRNAVLLAARMGAEMAARSVQPVPRTSLADARRALDLEPVPKAA